MNLYVGNLNYKVRESDLREVMEEYVPIFSINLPSRGALTSAITIE